VRLTQIAEWPKRQGNTWFSLGNTNVAFRTRLFGVDRGKKPTKEKYPAKAAVWSCLPLLLNHSFNKGFK
jgi:hypothetical protein